MYVSCSKFRLIRLRYINFVNGGSKSSFTTSSYLISGPNHQEEIANLNRKHLQIKTYKNAFGIPLINRSLERVLFDQLSYDKRNNSANAANTGNLQSAHEHLASFNIKVADNSTNKGTQCNQLLPGSYTGIYMYD